MNLPSYFWRKYDITEAWTGAVMENGRVVLWPLPVEILLWKCVTFFHTSLSSLSKGCTVTKIHQRWVWLVCIWVWFPLPPCSFGWTQLRSFCLLSLVEQWPRSDQPLSPTQTPKDTTLRQHLHSGSRKQKYVGFGFFLISKCFSLSPWRWMFHARWRSSAKHVNKLLTDKRSATSAARDFLTFL